MAGCFRFQEERPVSVLSFRMPVPLTAIYIIVESVNRGGSDIARAGARDENGETNKYSLLFVLL
jgi:hypothetical protein